MDGVFLKNYLIAHSNIDMNDASLLFDTYPAWCRLSTDEQLDYLAELQIKHAEAIIKNLGV